MSLCVDKFQLPEKNIIGGDYKEIYWRLHDADRGGYLDCTNLRMNFSLIDYVDRYGEPLISKECEAVAIEGESNATEFKVVLYKQDTQDFTGKYIYQLTIDTPDHKQQSLQGVMNILKNINPKAYLVEQGEGGE